MNFNNNVRKYRQAMGMSQFDLADAIGKAQSAVNFWENGNHSTFAWEIPVIAQVLHVTPYDLVGWDADEHAVWNTECIGENMRKYMAQQHISIKDLAKKMNVGKNAVDFWLNGDRTPSLCTIEKLASVFHIKESDLLQPNSQDTKRQE